MLKEKKFGGKILNIISDLCSLRSLSPSGGNGKLAFAYRGRRVIGSQSFNGNEAVEIVKDCLGGEKQGKSSREL